MELDFPVPSQGSDAKNSTKSDIDTLQSPALSQARIYGSHFVVCDYIFNSAPLKDMCAGESPTPGWAFPFDLVACTGHGHNGAICRFHRELRPVKSIHTDGLDGVIAVWALKVSKEMLMELRRRKSEFNMIDALQLSDGYDHAVVVARDRDTLVSMVMDSQGFR